MVLNLNNNSVVVFDLDDTLYNEIDYLHSAYWHIANKFLPESADNAYKKLMGWYNSGENAFDNLIEFFDLKSKGIDKHQLLVEYRYHFPKIKLRKGAIELLTQLIQHGITTGIITDGRALNQRNKLKALGIENLFELIIISEEIGSEKPALANFSIFESTFPTGNFFYIGDNTQKDFIAPNSLGWKTICYIDPGTNIHEQSFQLKKEYLPEHSINGFDEIKLKFE